MKYKLINHIDNESRIVTLNSIRHIFEQDLFMTNINYDFLLEQLKQGQELIYENRITKEIDLEIRFIKISNAEKFKKFKGELKCRKN